MFHKCFLKFQDVNYKRPWKKCLSINLIIFGIVNASTVSANENYIEEDSFFDEVETVVGATRLKQKVTKAPVSVTIIDKEMIEASGALEVYELMRFVPGYFAYSVSGNQFGVTSHFGADELPSRLEVRVDGRSVYQPIFDTVDWTSLGIDVLDIDHIEVVRGTSASVYGSNAFLGAINIITKGSLLQKHQTTIRATAGSNNTENLSLSHTGNLSGVDYFLSLNAKHNTGFKEFPVAGSPINKNIDGRRSLNVKFQGTYTPNIENKITFDFGFGENDIEIPSTLDPDGYSNREHDTNYQSLKWTSGIGKNQSTLSLYHNRLQLRDDLSFGVISDLLGVPSEQIPLIFPGQQDETIVLDNTKGVSDRIDIEYEKQFKSNDKLDVVFGVGARRDLVKSKYLLGGDSQTQNIFRFFSNVDYKASEKMNVNLGFLSEKTESLSSVFSPRLALNYQLNNIQTIRASVSKGLHSPSLTVSNASRSARFNDGTLINLFVNSPNNIKPEKIKSYELAYMHHFSKTDTQLDLKFFQEDLEDVVSISNEPFADIDQTVAVLGNNGFLKNKGIELQLEHKFSSVPKLNMRLAYAYIDSEIGSQNGDNSFSLRNSIPKHSATLMLNKKTKNGYRLGTVLQYQSDRDDSDEGIKRVDFNIGKTIDLSRSKTAKIDLGIQNAFNHYNDFTVRNDQDMRAFVRMQLDF